jgi:hypothetical protein
MAGTVQANCLDVKVPGVKLMSLPLPLKTVHGFTVTKMLCHKDMEIPLTKAFACVKLAGLEKEIQNTGGCFCYRNIAGTNRLSKHAQGKAIDINVGLPMHKGIVECFERAGFKWGGDFRRSDPMHFELTTEKLDEEPDTFYTPTSESYLIPRNKSKGE